LRGGARRASRNRTKAKYEARAQEKVANSDDDNDDIDIDDDDDDESDHDNNRKSKPAVISGGLTSTGLDPLELSLEALKPSSSSSSKKMSTSNVTRITSSSLSSNIPVPKTVIPRGLTVTKTKSAKNSKKAMIQKRYGGADDDLLEDLAPLCKSHNMKAKLATVKKSGKNKGKSINNNNYNYYYYYYYYYYYHSYH
jgi:hypothetical protein